MQEIFVKSLGNLTKMVAQSKELNKQMDRAEKTAQIKLEKSFERLKKLIEGIKKIFSSIFNIFKNITLGAMGTLAGFGLRGVVAQKQVAESRVLGVSSQERGALQFAGRASGFGEDFFKDILGSIKNAIVTEEGAGALSSLGIDINKARSMPSIELLNQVLERAKSSQVPVQVLSGFINQLTGLDWNTFKALDLSKFKTDFQEGMELSSNSADKLKGIGESLNKLTTGFSNLMDKTLAQFAPMIESIFGNISNGLKKIGESKVFNDMLKDIGDWAMSVSKGFDKSFENTLKEIPSIFDSLKITFYDLISGLSYLISYIPFIGDEATQKLRGISASFDKKSDLATIESEKKKALGAMPTISNKEDLASANRAYWDRIMPTITKSESLSKEEKDKAIEKAQSDFLKTLEIKIDVNNGGDVQRLTKSINLQKGN